MKVLFSFAVANILFWQSHVAAIKCLECANSAQCNLPNEGVAKLSTVDTSARCKTETIYDKLYKVKSTVRIGVPAASDCTIQNVLTDGEGTTVSCCDTEGCNNAAAATSFQYCFKCDGISPSCNDIPNPTTGPTTYDASKPVCKTVANYAGNALTQTVRSAVAAADCSKTVSTTGSGDGFITTCCNTPGCNNLAPEKTLFTCYSCSGAGCNAVVSGTTQTASALTFCQTKSTYLDYKLISVVRTNLFNECVSQDSRVKGSGSNVECCKGANCNNATKEDMPSLNCYVCTSCNSIASDTFTSNLECVACKTNTIYANQIVTSTSRSCSVSPCSPADVSGGTGTKIECCSTNLCNKESKHASRILVNFLMINAAGFLVFIFYFK